MKNNIFARCGKIITGDYYVPRIELEKRLRSRTIDGVENANFGSISVTGMQRMGKSTLVHNTILRNKEEYYEKNVIIVNVTMSICSTPGIFFHTIVDNVYEALEDHDDIDSRLIKKYEKAKNVSVEAEGAKSIQNFFRYVNKMGKTVICVIDEFDCSQKLFKNFSEGFIILRELSYQPETNVSFIFISRRMISELESNAGISTLSNILGEPLFVKGYTDSDCDKYFERNKKFGFEISKYVRERFKKISGNLPYWLDLLLNDYYQLEDNKKNIDDVVDQCSGCLFNEFDETMKLLKEQKLLDKLYQMIFGPAFDYTESDMRKLIDYGIITIEETNDNSRYVRMVSEKFYMYMKMRESSINFYPLWNKTERNLRSIAKQQLRKRYGKDWEQTLIDTYLTTNKTTNSINKYLRDATRLQEKVRHQKDLYIEGCSYTIIDAMTTAGLFSIYLNEYHLFNEIFKMSKDEFFTIQTHLCKARNPYQHNNDDIIDPAFKKLTKDYCNLLNKKIEAYEKSSNK